MTPHAWEYTVSSGGSSQTTASSKRTVGAAAVGQLVERPQPEARRGAEAAAVVQVVTSGERNRQHRLQRGGAHKLARRTRVVLRRRAGGRSILKLNREPKIAK